MTFIDMTDFPDDPFFPSLCNITTKGGTTRDALGGSVKGAPVTVLSVIRCRVVTDSALERVSDPAGNTVSTHTIRLKGCYPTIGGAHQAVVDGDTYNILLPDDSGTASYTHLKVRKTP